MVFSFTYEREPKTQLMIYCLAFCDKGKWNKIFRHLWDPYNKHGVSQFTTELQIIRFLAVYESSARVNAEAERPKQQLTI